MTTFRLLDTVAGASFRSLVAFECGPSDVRGGSWRRSSSATPPPGVAAPSFPGVERGVTSFHVGVGASAKLDVGAMATGTLGGTQDRGTEVVAGTRRSPAGVHHNGGAGRLGGIRAARVVGMGIGGTHGQLPRSGNTAGVGRPSSRRLSSSAQVGLGERVPDLPVVGGTAALGRLSGVAPWLGGELAMVVGLWRRSSTSVPPVPPW